MRDLKILEEIEKNPYTTQANLATQLGVAVGTVNWHLKRMIAKGYIKVKRLQRKRLRYMITPEGIAARARLTMAYIDNSMKLYRLSRDRARDLIMDIKRRGFSGVRIVGDGDIADVCRLTCLEQGLRVIAMGDADGVPALLVDGMQISILEPGEAVSMEQDIPMLVEQESGSSA